MMVKRHSLSLLVLGSIVLSGIVLQGCGGAGGGTVTNNANSDTIVENANSNEALTSTPCEDGSVDMFIDGVPQGQIGPDSTLLLSAVPCTASNYAYDWSWEGPVDEGDLQPTNAKEVTFNIFSPGDFTITVIATDMQSGTRLTSQVSFEAVIGGPPFSL